VVNLAIKPYQTEGLFGKRDIHRRPFEVCAIPEFDSKNPRHKAIVASAKEAKSIVQEWGPKMKGKLAKVREACRKLLAEQMGEIDEHTTQILGPAKSHRGKVRKGDISPQGSMF
jgi:hypothetical protein